MWSVDCIVTYLPAHLLTLCSVPGNEDVKKTPRQWDEEVFGLEYDLDIYMIVAASQEHLKT